MAVAWPQATHAQAEAQPQAQTQLPSPEQLQLRRRVAVSWLGAAGGMVLGVASTLAVLQLAVISCATDDDGDKDFGCVVGGAIGASLFGAVSTPALTTLGAALPHHRRGGRGRWWMGLMGSLLGTGVLLACLMAAEDANNGAFIGAAVGGSLSIPTLSVLFLEIDHANRKPSGLARRAPPLTLSARPLRDGFSVGIAARL